MFVIFSQVSAAQSSFDKENEQITQGKEKQTHHNSSNYAKLKDEIKRRKNLSVCLPHSTQRVDLRLWSLDVAAAPLTLCLTSPNSHRMNRVAANVPKVAHPALVPQGGASSSSSGASLLPAGVCLPSSRGGMLCQTAFPPNNGWAVRLRCEQRQRGMPVVTNRRCKPQRALY